MQQPSTMLDHPLVSSRYFSHGAKHSLILIGSMPPTGSKLACSYHGVVNPAAITVVYFHGNGEVVADYLPAFQTG